MTQNEVTAESDGSKELPKEPLIQENKAGFPFRRLPYVLLLVLAIVGVAYTNMSQRPLVGYWEFLAVLTGVVCVVGEWSKAVDNQARLRLAWTQALHWAAVLVMMNIMLLSGVQQMFPSPASGLVLLALLALGTFLAGLNLLSPELCFLGFALALAVPAIAWLKLSALFLVLGAVFLVGLVISFWPRRFT